MPLECRKIALLFHIHLWILQKMFAWGRKRKLSMMVWLVWPFGRQARGWTGLGAEPGSTPNAKRA